MSNFISPEAVVMLLAAVLLDTIGFLFLFLSFLGVGIPLSFIPDLIGLIFIGGWMFLRSGARQKRIGKRLGLAFLGEIIPFFGDIAPCWTLAVFFELKNN
ncbi:MAG: hypothetical protein PHI53_02505 [Candidatus Pacebacteria bacterium]|nr:hypothetical protein [Candidatus Paceibacterota bacterium]